MISSSLLAIDTATEVASVAIRLPGRTPVAASRAGARRHSADLLPMIGDITREAGIALGDLGGVAISDGPGSFTGLRIGWAVAKGLAHERKLPLYTVPSLFGAAFAAWRNGGQEEGPVAACFDALRGQVFAALYRFTPGGTITLVAPSLVTVAELTRVAPARPRMVVTDSQGALSDELYVWTGRMPLTIKDLAHEASVALALCELADWPGGKGSLELVRDAGTREPVYGRPAEAQVKWEARHGRPLRDPTGSTR